MNKTTIWLSILIVLGTLFFSALFLFSFNSNKQQINLMKQENESLQIKLQHLTNELNTKTREFDFKVKDFEKSNSSLKEEKQQLQQKIQEVEKTNNYLKKQLEAKANSNKAIASNSSNTNSSSGNGTNGSNGVNTNKTKTAYLTFDDGPSQNTLKVLDILKSYGIKATFFVNGKSSTESKAIYNRILAEGHSIGNHTYSHDYSYIYKSKENYFKDHNKLNDLLNNSIGYTPNLVRFPGGSNNTVSHKYGYKGLTTEIASELTNQGYVFFDWNVDSTDASVAKQVKEKIVSSVLNGAKNKTNAVVLFHDSKAKTTTVEALPEVIEGLKEQGFTFSSLNKNSYAPQFINKKY